MQFADRMQYFASAIFAELADKKRRMIAQGRDIIDLSVGSPDRPPAPHVREALSSHAAGTTDYAYAISDLPQLRQAAAGWYSRRYQVDLNPDTEIVSLLGSQDGLSHLALTLANPGDVVLVPDPCYPIFGMSARLACADVHYMPMLRENNYLIDFDAIDPAVARRAKLMVVSYPNNPVCAVAPRDFYGKLVAFAQKYDIVVLHDNAYAELTFEGGPCGSFLSVPGAMAVGVEFNSLSKSHNMAGCRMGFALGNADIVGKLKALKSHLDYGAFLPVQWAAIAALNGPQDVVIENRRILLQRRDTFIDGLTAAGWPADKPAATMFAWVPVPRQGISAYDFAMEMMDRTGVVASPGSSFGPSGEGFLRFALVQPEPRLQQAVERILESGILDT